MSKVSELNNFVNELQIATKEIDSIEVNVDYYLNNVENIRLHSDVDVETKDEIKSLQNSLKSTCERIKAIADRYNQNAEALLVAIGTAKKIVTRLVAYSKLDTKIFADAERSDTAEDYESSYELDENKAIDELIRNSKIKEEVQESCNALFRDGFPQGYSKDQLVQEICEDVLYEEMPEAIKNFFKHDYDLNISHGKYAYSGDEDEIIDDAIEALLKNSKLRNAIKSEVERVVTKKMKG